MGAIKLSAGRRWLLLDGGLADNIRPALYGARYSALPEADTGLKGSSGCHHYGPFHSVKPSYEEDMAAIALMGVCDIGIGTIY